MAADGFKGFSLQEAESNINRRTFIERTLLAAGAACVPWPASGESPYLEDHSHNWRAWRESLKRVLEETGHTFRWAELETPIGGFRRARVHVTDETGIATTLIWFQPWSGNRIDE